MHKILLAGFSCLALAGCGTPETAAQRAQDAACTAQADAQYRANTVDLGARTDQTGLKFPATPTQAFDAERLGAEHDFQSQLSRCEKLGASNGAPEVNCVPVVAPHIITN